MWEYAPAPENRDIANLKPSYRMFVDGKFVEGTGEPLKTINPATEEVLAEVSTASQSDVDTGGTDRHPPVHRTGRWHATVCSRWIWRVAPL